MVKGDSPYGAGEGSQASKEGLQEMQALLKEEGMGYPSFRRGDVVEGVVVEVGRDGLLVDIGTKSEGVVPSHEMRTLGPEAASRIHPGDTVLVWVLRPETPEGQVLLSLDRALAERGWRTLQQRFEQGESFEAQVTGYNKGGLLVDVEGLAGFVPLSQLVSIRANGGSDEGVAPALAEAVGRHLRLKVIELNRRRNRVILSERAAVQEWRSQQKERLLAELQEGEIRQGRITSIREFGIFVDLGGADGLAHLSEVSWDRSRPLEEMYKVGDEVDVYIMKVDPESKRIALSIRRAQPERWDDIIDKYQVGQIVVGRVTKLVPFGAFARLDGPVEGLIHVSELAERRLSHPKEVVKEGDILPLKIIRIERDRQRLGLSLRQARAEAEALGYEFDESGGVVNVPEEVKLELQAEEETADSGETRQVDVS